MNIPDGILKKEELILMALRALYRKYGYAQYKMRKFEEYDLLHSLLCLPEIQAEYQDTVPLALLRDCRVPNRTRWPPRIPFSRRDK